MAGNIAAAEVIEIDELMQKCKIRLFAFQSNIQNGVQVSDLQFQVGFRNYCGQLCEAFDRLYPGINLPDALPTNKEKKDYRLLNCLKANAEVVRRTVALSGTTIHVPHIHCLDLEGSLQALTIRAPRLFDFVKNARRKRLPEVKFDDGFVRFGFADGLHIGRIDYPDTQLNIIFERFYAKDFELNVKYDK